MRYLCLASDAYSYEQYLLVPIRKKDIILIKDWRNQQINVLRQKKVLTNRDQLVYYRKVIRPSFIQEHPGLILFSYLQNDQCIGYGGLTNIDWEVSRAEVSFLMNPEHINNPELYQKEFTVFLQLLKNVAFEDLGMNRLFTETYDIRPNHIATLELNGFKREGRMLKHVMVQGQLVDSLIHGFLREWYYVDK